MSTSLTVNGVSYLYPDTGDQSWGTVASAWAAAVTSGMLQKAGGSFALTADTNFGSNFGLLAKYFTSQTASAAASGVVRLANTEAIAWRNNAGGGDVLLAKNSSDQLTWNGTVIASSAGVVPVAAGGTGLTSGTSGGILGFTASGVIASSVALTASQLVIGGGAGATPTTLAAGSQYQVLVMGASNPGYGQVNLAQSAAVTGVLPNANTTAASANTASTIVARDGSGNFIAGTITATLTGTASGNLTYSANNHGVLISGSANTVTVIAPDSSATKVLKSGGASADPTWLAYDNANTVSTLVFRDSSGNFLAGTITATLTGTASGNTTYTANNHGVVISGSANVMTVIAPDASTSKVLKSGGSSADPSWLAYTDAATASVLMSRDANANTSVNNILEGYATTATAATTTTLAVGSKYRQYFTGSTTQTCVLPDATTLVLGHTFYIVNLSSGIVTVKDGGGSTTVQAMATNSFMTITVTNIGTTAGTWNVSYSVNNAGGGTVTSVAMTLPSALFTTPPTGSPITTSGTLALALATQVKNLVFAGPSTGSDATPTFRSIVNADLPLPVVQTKTTTYLRLAADDLINCSGSAFTVTLDAASTGRPIRIRKTDTSLSNIITIARAGSDVISVSGGTTTSTTLNSLDEEIYLIPDGGTTWSLAQRNYSGVAVTYTPTVQGTTGTAPTVNFEYFRIPGGLRIVGQIIYNGTASAVTMSFTAPTGGTPALSPSKAASAGAGSGKYSLTGGGVAYGSGNQATVISGNVIWDNANAKFIFKTADTWQTSGTSVPVVTYATGDTLDVDFSYPVSGWF